MNPEILAGIRQYVAGDHPHEFGGFVTALLANDLVGAFMCADGANRRAMGEYAAFLYNEMPWRTGNARRDYWGSYEAVRHRITEQQAADAAGHS